MAGAAPRPSCVKRHPTATRSIVPVNPLAPLMALLGLDREGGNWTGLQALDRDRLAGLFAIAVGSIVDPVQCSIDLVDQLALTVAGAKLDGPIGFGRGAIGQVRMVLVLVLQVLQGILGLFQDVVAPERQLFA